MNRFKHGILYGIAFALCTFSTLMYLSYGSNTVDVLTNHTTAEEYQGMLLTLTYLTLMGMFAFLAVSTISDHKVITGVFSGILALVFTYWSLLLFAWLANFTVRLEDLLGLELLKGASATPSTYLPLLGASFVAGLITLPFMRLRKRRRLEMRRST